MLLQQLPFDYTEFQCYFTSFLNGATRLLRRLPLDWPAVLQELLRVCRPGGTIIWTETTFPTTNSPACRQWCEFMHAAIVQSGYTPDVTPYMERLLSDINYYHIQRSETCIDISAGTAFNERIYRHAATLLSLLQPLLLHKNVASMEKMNNLCRNTIIDLYKESFRGQWVLVTITCEKSTGIALLTPARCHQKTPARCVAHSPSAHELAGPEAGECAPYSRYEDRISRPGLLFRAA